jgi:predicted DNA-binding protein
MYYATLVGEMASPITLRIDRKTRQRVERIARRKGTTTSQVLRDAIENWVEREDTAGSAYDRIKHLIGVIEGGDPALSVKTGRRFAERLRTRRGSL